MPLSTLNELRECFTRQEAALQAALQMLNSGQLFDARAVDGQLDSIRDLERTCQLTLDTAMGQHPSEKAKMIIIRKANDLRAAVLEALHKNSTPPHATLGQPCQTVASTNVATKMAASNQQPDKVERRNTPPPARIDARCRVCLAKPAHDVDKCATFVAMTLGERVAAAGKACRCWVCLGFHPYGKCSSGVMCEATTCNHREHHHSLLHGAPKYHKAAPATPQPRPTIVAAIAEPPRTFESPAPPLLDIDDIYQQTIGVVVPLLTTDMLLGVKEKKQPKK